MNFVIGFGKTETDFERQEIEAFEEYARSRFVGRGEGYITSQYVEDVNVWMDERAKACRDQASKHDKAADPPSRYSYYYPHIASSASAIVAIFKFSHINRRHAMSPDGWALMLNERVTHLWSYDMERNGD